MSQARGWKAGGYPNWEITDLIPMDCPGCQRRMDLLLTIDSSESDGGIWRTVEESTLRPQWADPAWEAVNEPTGVVVGRHGKLRVFACHACPGTPIRLNIQ